MDGERGAIIIAETGVGDVCTVLNIVIYLPQGISVWKSELGIELGTLIFKGTGRERFRSCITAPSFLPSGCSRFSHTNI